MKTLRESSLDDLHPISNLAHGRELALEELDEVNGGFKFDAGPLGKIEFTGSSSGFKAGINILGYGVKGGYTTEADGSHTYMLGGELGRIGVLGAADVGYNTVKGIQADANVGFGVKGWAELKVGASYDDNGPSVNIGAGLHTPSFLPVAKGDFDVKLVENSTGYHVEASGKAGAGGFEVAKIESKSEHVPYDTLPTFQDPTIKSALPSTALNPQIGMPAATTAQASLDSTNPGADSSMLAPAAPQGETMVDYQTVAYDEPQYAPADGYADLSGYDSFMDVGGGDVSSDSENG